jgi:replicative DNA helicase
LLSARRMPDIHTLIAQVSSVLRETNFASHQDAYDAATHLRHTADQIENSAIAEELRPWWDHPDEGVSVSQR